MKNENKKLVLIYTTNKILSLINEQLTEHRSQLQQCGEREAARITPTTYVKKKHTVSPRRSDLTMRNVTFIFFSDVSIVMLMIVITKHGIGSSYFASTERNWSKVFRNALIKYLGMFTLIQR